MRGFTERNGGSARTVIFFFWVILIFSQLSLGVVAGEEKGRFSPRKTRLFNGNPSFPAALGGNAGGDLYAEDKRVIRTGPNPLHN
ncbi:hypothetical protein Nepgr_017007 [Nepenthes gracilis]|uniref:Uncharacterized protein n=1 Tax=Nepenthes gracilis TaxID=150966 RepID=A0AAD3XSW4_NEPGR|nr:hypothetical protein Nepgr_017007 [Nepenthes gracilis]